MKYELAKGLKDAGFSQEADSLTYSLYYREDGESLKLRSFENDKETKIPTLSELIEACNYSHAFDLNYRKNTRKWRAFMNGVPHTKACFGPTPEEAVARLWLALNKK